jgi:two-component system chemotaxis sensor kinase CheA
MHTLKGMAATMGYDALANIAHRMEDVFDALRFERIKLSPQMMDIIFEAIDSFTSLIEDFKEERPFSVEISSCLDKLSQIVPKEEGKKIFRPQEVKLDVSLFKRLKDKYKNIFRIEISLEKDCPMKGVRAFLIIERTRHFGELVKSFPSEEKLKAEEFDRSFDLILATNENKKNVEKELSRILEVEKVKINPFDLESLKKLERKDTGGTATYLRKIQSMRIPVERLDKIMNLMGELVIAKSRLIQIGQTKDYEYLEETTYLIERLVSSLHLQDEVLKLRLLPVSYILNNFPRIVRDLARKRDKKVDLEIKGSKIKLDRMILDEIGYLFIIHLIRNAIDHGIEPLEERKKLGKNPQGKISIKVFRERSYNHRN